MAGLGPTRSVERLFALEVHFDAYGFELHYLVATALLTLNAAVHLRNQRAASAIPGHCETMGGAIQSGYARCTGRTLLRIMTMMFGIWLQILMYDITECKYRGGWSFTTPDRPLDWNSYTRAFLAAWLGSLGALLLTRFVLRKGLRTHFLRPVHLEEAEFVWIDEGGEYNFDRDALMFRPVERLGSQRPRISHRLQRYCYSEATRIYSRPSKWQQVSGHALRRLFDSREMGLPGVGPAGEALGETWRIDRRRLHGPNTTEVIVQGYFMCFVAQSTSLFNLYQYFSCWLMFYWDYITVGCLFSVLVVSTIMVKVSAERSTNLSLQKLALLECSVMMLDTTGAWRRSSSNELVPGDVVLITDKSCWSEGRGQVPCDLAIIQGHCIVDESLLTGEAMPVTKVCVPDDDIARPPARVEFKKHYLFAGTHVVQAAGVTADVVSGAIGVVVATAGATARGELLQNLIYGDQAQVAFTREVGKVVLSMVSLAILGFVVVNLRYGFELGPFLSGVFLFVGLVSPMLSVALIGGQLASSKRLELEHDVFCRDVEKVAVAGAIEAMLFDKTGTLTEQHLDLLGFLPPANAPIGVQLLQLSDLMPQRGFESSNSTTPPRPALPKEMQACLALAHAVRSVAQRDTARRRDPEEGSPEAAAVDEMADASEPWAGRRAGTLVGQELEICMVRAAEKLGWGYDWSAERHRARHPQHGSFEVVRSFAFDYELATMSIVARDSDGDLHAFCKGSIEALRTRIRAHDLAPGHAADRMAREGCYVLGCAHKVFKPDTDAETLCREDVESELAPVGALVFHNQLRSCVAHHLAALQAGGIATRMVTGDHALTAVSVARSAGIVPRGHEVWLGEVESGIVRFRGVDCGLELAFSELPASGTMAVTGAVFDVMRQESGPRFTSLLDPAVESQLAIRVFARASPAQKVSIVEALQSVGLVVGFCGDGGNDSGALRAAHAGLALAGEVEASMAAPCCTSSPSLDPLVALVAEGRASLCTSLAAVRFVVLKGLLHSLARLALLLTCGAYLAPMAYLYVDVFMCPFFLWAITRTAPRQRGLAPSQPESSLLATRSLLALVMCFSVDAIFLYLSMALLSMQSWFVPFDGLRVPLYAWQFRADSFESPVAALWMSWCVVDFAVILSYGGEHRAPINTNGRIISGAVFCHMLQFLVLMGENTWIGCTVKTNCDAHTYQQLEGAMINEFLFDYERVGGEFYAPDGSNHMRSEFKWGFFFLLSLTSLAKHGVYHLVEGAPRRQRLPAISTTPFAQGHVVAVPGGASASASCGAIALGCGEGRPTQLGDLRAGDNSNAGPTVFRMDEDDSVNGDSPAPAGRNVGWRLPTIGSVGGLALGRRSFSRFEDNVGGEAPQPQQVGRRSNEV